MNSEERRAAREAAGKPAYPLKVTVTRTGDLEADLKFWNHGGEKVAYTTDAAAEKLKNRLGKLADVVSTGEDLDFGKMLDDLGERGIERLMVEGGGQIHTAFLSQGLVDEIHLVVAPLVVGQSDAPRFLQPANYPWPTTRRMTLAEARPIGDVVLLRYLPKQESGA